MATTFHQRDGEFRCLVAVCAPIASRHVEQELDAFLRSRSMHNMIRIFAPEGEAGDQATRWARENGHAVERFEAGEEGEALDKVDAAILFGPSPWVRMVKKRLATVRVVECPPMPI